MAGDSVKESSPSGTDSEGFFSHIVTEIVTSPLNLFLLSICLLLLYKIYKSSRTLPPGMLLMSTC